MEQKEDQQTLQGRNSTIAFFSLWSWFFVYGNDFWFQ